MSISYTTLGVSNVKGTSLVMHLVLAAASAEQVTTSDDSLLLLLLLLGGLGSSSGRGSATSSRGSRGSGQLGELLRGHVEELVPLLGILEGEVGHGRDGEHLADGASEAVRERGLRGDSNSEGEGSEEADTTDELSAENILADVKDGAVEDRAVHKDLEELNTISEGKNVELLEQTSLGSTDLITLVDELELGNDFDLTLHDLSGDVEGLEPRGLSGVASSGSGGNKHILLGNLSSLGGGSLDVALDDGADLVEVLLDEDKTAVSDEVGGELADGVVGVLLNEGSDDLAHQGVLSHEHGGLMLAELLADLGELAGGNVVDTDDEDGLVRLEQLLHAAEVSRFRPPG